MLRKAPTEAASDGATAGREEARSAAAVAAASRGVVSKLGRLAAGGLFGRR